MNLPNRLTVGRFFLTLAFVAALSSEWPFRYLAGLIFFVVAGITDYLDGEIARRQNLVTDFGKLMDPLVDKIMLAAGFICLIPAHALPAWAAVVIISREFLITGLRLLAANKGVLLSAERAGKHKTIWQIVTVLFFLTLLALHELNLAGSIPFSASWMQAWWLAWFYGGRTLVGLTLILTLYSGLSYLWKNRGLVSTG